MRVKINKTIEISARHLAEHLQINFGFNILHGTKFQFQEYGETISLNEINAENNESIFVKMSIYSWKGFLRKLLLMEGILKENEPNSILTIEFKKDCLELEII